MTMSTPSPYHYRDVPVLGIGQKPLLTTAVVLGVGTEGTPPQNRRRQFEYHTAISELHRSGEIRYFLRPMLADDAIVCIKKAVDLTGRAQLLTGAENFLRLGTAASSVRQESVVTPRSGHFQCLHTLDSPSGYGSAVFFCRDRESSDP